MSSRDIAKLVDEVIDRFGQYIAPILDNYSQFARQIRELVSKLAKEYGFEKVDFTTEVYSPFETWMWYNAARNDVDTVLKVNPEIAERQFKGMLKYLKDRENAVERYVRTSLAHERGHVEYMRRKLRECRELAEKGCSERKFQHPYGIAELICGEFFAHKKERMEDPAIADALDEQYLKDVLPEEIAFISYGLDQAMRVGSIEVIKEILRGYLRHIAHFLETSYRQRGRYSRSYFENYARMLGLDPKFVDEIHRVFDEVDKVDDICKCVEKVAKAIEKYMDKVPALRIPYAIRVRGL